jgi:putative sterol carrier protein
MSEPMTAQQVLDAMPGAFLPEKAGDASARFQVELEGEGGGVWTIEVKDRACHVLAGPAEDPGVTIRMDAADFVAFSTGKLDPIRAFMGGKFKINGNVGLVLQMMQWFER